MCIYSNQLSLINDYMVSFYPTEAILHRVLLKYIPQVTQMCLHYRTAPNICETIFLWILVIPCIAITKILDSKFLVLHMFSITGFVGWIAPCHHQMETFLYYSIQFYSCSEPGSVKIATRRCDWASHLVCVIIYPERNLHEINTKTERYHWKLCSLAWNKCCSMTLQEMISRIEIVKSQCML